MIKPGMFISDRYEIIDKVGSGGMADVYKAKCHRLNRNVAIKILKTEYSDDKNFVSKFRAEAQSAAGLSHPNIVNVYDVGDDDGLYYIVMELVEGITLKRFIERKKKLEIKEAVGIAIQIAGGMEAAHQNHIIHRDIKPQNIIISRDGKVKVTDFGIAKAASSNTITQTALGSVHYLSPEQARGGYSDEKSDIYSLGVTLYEMLTGRVPFSGDNTVSVALLHIQSEAETVREINPDIPVSIDKIVQKCMQKKPERRYLAASELITDLKRAIINPDGDFVELSNGAVPDSPTIHMTDDELKTIKSAAKKPSAYNNVSVNKKKNGREIKKIQREDDEDIDSVDSRFEKFVVIGTICIVIMLGVAIIYSVAKFFNIFDTPNNNETELTKTPTPIITLTTAPLDPDLTPDIPIIGDEVKLPSVLGLSIEQAKIDLDLVSPKFDVKYIEGDYSSEIEKDLIIKQEPDAESMVAPDAIITLYYSLGKESKEIPDVRSARNLGEAQTILNNAGFTNIKPYYEHNEDVLEDGIIKTIPEAANLAYVDDEITIVVSSGPDQTMTKVPNIMRKTQTDAKAELLLAELNPGEVSYINSDVYPKDQVCYQSTTADTKVSKGTTIDYSISLGPKIRTYSYTFTIDDQPFEPDESAWIVYEFYQMRDDGEYKEIIFEGYLSYDDFEKKPVERYQCNYNGPAYLYVFINDESKYYYEAVVKEIE